MSPTPLGHDRRRFSIGLFVGADLRRVSGAIIAAHGAGLDARADVEAAASAPISPHTRRLFRELARGRRGRPPALVSVLASELADAEAACIHKLAARQPALGQRTLCAAVADPGLWREETPLDRSCLSLCDGARLAELSGMNVLDAMAARDLAQQGRGGPLLAAPYWLLLRQPDRARVVVHVDAATEITLLPASRDASAIDGVGSASIGIGRPALALLARRLDAAAAGLGAGGRAAKTDESKAAATQQSAPRPELLAAWSAEAALQPALEDLWRGSGFAPGPLVDAMTRSIGALNIPAPQALRTAIRWLAQLVADRVSGALAGGAAGDLILAGPGRKLVLLREDLATLLPSARLLDDAALGFPIAEVNAAATAWWGQLYLDQTPGNLPALTGANAPRVLGRFTPGSPRNFLQLVRAMAKGQPVVSLRTAI